jgi:hypothetical protein
MSHLRKDFIEPLRKVNITVRGFAGVTVKEVYTGTIKWKIPDDTGAITEFVIPNSYYVPSGGVRLLSPQHLAQVCKDNYPKPKGTQLVTYDDHCVLYWNQLRRSLTIPIDPKTNVFTLTSAAGVSKYQAYCASAESIFSDEIPILHCMDTKIIRDEEGEEIAKTKQNQDLHHCSTISTSKTKSSGPNNGNTGC